jgi:hypothetical protein
LQTNWEKDEGNSQISYMTSRVPPEMVPHIISVLTSTPEMSPISKPARPLEMSMNRIAKGHLAMDFPDNPNCRKTGATLQFVGIDLDPDDVTAFVGIEPDMAHKRGAVRLGKGGRSYRYPRGIWSVTTEGWKSRNLEAHLVSVLDRIEPAMERFVAFHRNRPEVRFEVMCYWVSETGHGGPSLSPLAMSRVASLGATLFFDFYSTVVFEDDALVPTQKTKRSRSL